MDTEMVRRRKVNITKSEPDKKPPPEEERSQGDSPIKKDGQAKSRAHRVVRILSCILGLVTMAVFVACVPPYYEQLHDAHLWFTNIMEVEREISFRTESGLYYSYYKQFLSAPTVKQGVYELINDNITEHGRTINILERFNIYQELVLGLIYRALNIDMQPIYFYIRTVWNLHGMMIGAIYLLTWRLSRSWLAGSLAVLFYIFNRADTTRSEYSMPLRESWSLPFLWVQQVFLTYYLQSDVRTNHWLSLGGILISTFLFNITWQFSQFTLLLQSMALFGVWSLSMVPVNKIVGIYLYLLVSLMSVCALQFFNHMILGSLVMGFIPAALIVMAVSEKTKMKERGVVAALLSVVLEVVSVLVLMIVISNLIKAAINLNADEHIFKFVLNKLGLAKYRDFDVQLYLCNGAFEFIGYYVMRRLSERFLFPFYVIVHAFLIGCLVYAVFQSWRCKSEKSPPNHIFSDRPEWTFHIVQCALFGTLAISTQRMKYFWVPYMCVLASAGMGDYVFWEKFLNKTAGKAKELAVQGTRHLITGFVIGCLLYTFLTPAREELNDLREFYDPDTVELMQWINKEVPKNAAFTGSMQLLAGVKLCTGRPLTNHPHYEDAHLRQRTKELYRMYGKFSPDEVHDVMVKYNTSYLILEDSICLAGDRGDGCRLPDIVDITYGLVPDNYPSNEDLPDLKKSSYPHFCNTIRHGNGQYAKLFKLVFSNKTFRVYKVAESKHTP